MEDFDFPPPPDRNSFSSLKEWLQAMSAHQARLDHIRQMLEVKRLAAEIGELGKTVTVQRRPIGTYAAQITDWFNALPTAAKVAPRSMEEFINMLEGRTKGMRAHPGEVAKVLRRLGWTRQREWKADGEGRRVWLPPLPKRD